jgi:mannose-6-phosphate isomerase-like protein (cupin superfamily)
MRTIKLILRIVAGFAGVLGLYIIFSIVISEYLFPADTPDYSNYFRPGDKLASRFEGFDQTVLSVNGDWMNTRLEVKPGAAGPPEHFHADFEERFTVKSGMLSILVNGEKKTLKAGETLSIPPMTRHKPFNETNETVVVEGDRPNILPVKFGYALSQLYGFMDQYPNGPSTRQVLLQLSVYGNEADTWIADGPSLNTQKAMRVILAPTARLLGYRNYYEEFKPRR